MPGYEQWMLVWTAVTGVSAAMTVLIVLVAAVLTYGQIREATRARRLQSALAIFEHISSPDRREARRLVYEKGDALNAKILEDPSWSDLDAFLVQASDGRVDFQRFRAYLAALENVAMLVLYDLAPDNLVDMYLGQMAPSQWKALSPFIVFMRRRYGTDEFLQHFEMLAMLMERDGLWRWSRQPTTWWRYIGRLRHSRSREKRRLLRERYAIRQRG